MGTWTKPLRGPLSGQTSGGVWADERLVFLTGNDVPGRDVDGTFDPATARWDTLSPGCDLDTTDAVWTGSLIISVYQRLAFDPATGRCYTIPRPPRPLMGRAVQEWTGRDFIVWSGSPALLSDPTRAGQAYRPPP